MKYFYSNKFYRNKFTVSTLLLSMLALNACSDNQSNANQATQPNQASSAIKADSENVTNAILGAGASFPQPIYAKWSADFKNATGGQVNYQSIGSSAGVKQIIANTVDFGATDAPLTKAEQDKEGLIQFPTVIGGVVPIVNVDGVTAGQLKLDGATLANIYLGKIKQWNDPAIVALNPNLTLPNSNIITVFRSDGSGTTFNFTHYLSAVSKDWQTKVGANKTIKWPTAQTGVGAKGNEGVASNVARAKNAIGYVEYAYAKQNNMAYVSLKNQAGNFVQPSIESFAAAGDINWSADDGFNVVLTNQAAVQAWPISAATFILVHKQPKNPEKVKNVLAFFDWAYQKGDDSAKSLDFVPFSTQSKQTFRQSWQQVVDSDNKPLYTINP
ncbi:phosphate ABC transporter substrate-binding protein [Moraxella macacae 0408225]|uniref:Phosphate-binding protein PstS n=1 Tax=Moraxella macacae 0408225 TaxID=1230338 RepID=L2F5X7_9GAMM|nr:phosphate ABC transporter substrate-binding protein PstS [Moraxella macacae]ELA08171.1 phosphate ABC transporter substrate-binding protein [Moraxella macacae 0408225]